MDERRTAEYLFETTIGLVFGLGSSAAAPLGGTEPIAAAAPAGRLSDAAYEILRQCAGEGGGGFRDHDGPMKTLFEEARAAKEVFCDFYTRKENSPAAAEALEKLGRKNISAEEKAKIVSAVWAPESVLPDEDILLRWKLREVLPNPRPIVPTEVVLQLNALYTLPESFPETIPKHLREAAGKAAENPGKKIADYDHPVPLFEDDSRHELVSCLGELDGDLAFEKEMSVIPHDYKVPVLISLSVTHEDLDEPCGRWIHWLLKKRKYNHIKLFILTENGANSIRKRLLGTDLGVFSVFGTYARHFNALKYSQLLLEKAYGMRAGIKLDTDEGIRSRDLYRAKGSTWFQILCHPYWGGNALDWKEKPVSLAVNIGEYMNDKDIRELGYENALRAPDVKPPESAAGDHILFNKAAAHGRATALYNGFDHLEDFVSHPVVKGGGYGIMNDGLRKAVPFAHSLAGRAEDQQFFFSGLPGGIRGIFHPDLRIAHYKSSVSASERKTAVSRLVGDMYRLILFQHLAEMLDVKEAIDPMPGVFAGGLARAQAFFHLLHHAVTALQKNLHEAAEELLTDGINRLRELKKFIDEGTVTEQFKKEQKQWRVFIERADASDPEKVRAVLEELVVQ